MKIGIIVYSKTGNTLAVAKKLQEKLAAAGHTANLEQITVTGDVAKDNWQLADVPAVQQYELVVFGAPVQAFSLASPMASYLKQLSSLSDKKVACLVTKQLPFYWTGGNRAVATMKTLSEAKGATVVGTEMIIWSKKDREQIIDACIERLSSQLVDSQ